MYAMNFDITIGPFRLTTLESVVVTRSVENLADTATITLPGAVCSYAPELETMLGEGDPVCIRLGYDARGQELPVEFEGFVSRIGREEGAVKIRCEDGICRFRRDLKNAVLASVSVKELLEHVLRELGGLELSCDYDFKYDRFAIYETTGFDVLKKVQEETRANIYLRGTTLHVHPQYAETGRRVICDSAVNIERSDLRYREAGKQKLIVAVEGTDAKGRTVKVTRGTPGGDKFTLKLPGVSDRTTLERRAEEELHIRDYTGYEGSFTGWLVPRIEPADVVELRDADHEYRTGKYYVVAVETTFSAEGGSRKTTIGKKLG